MHPKEVRNQQLISIKKNKRAKNIYSELADNINSAAMAREVERERERDRKKKKKKKKKINKQ